MKTTITADQHGYVTISYDDYLNERVTRTFFCPVNGGYVKEQDKQQQYPQVCERLSSRGNTLECSSRDKLLDLIRREYRAMRRAEKREDSRY